MFRPLFASLLGIALTLPGCPKRDATCPQPPPPQGPYIGQPAPEIDGVDLDGEAMKLSDFRGQVVAVSFWANWCCHCRDLFPHEKDLVEQFRGQPFVLLGVNADESRVLAKRVHDQNQLTWRSFHAGDAAGPIPTQWGVSGWPTTYIIDAKGTVRYRLEGKQPQNVERAIRSLLSEIEIEKKNSPKS